jgi:hypothetical protein
MFSAFDPNNALRFSGTLQHRLNKLAGAELIFGSADKQLGLCATLEEFVGIAAAFRAIWNSQTDYPCNARVRARGTHPNEGAERKARKQDGEMKIGVEPVECGACILKLSASVIKLSLAEAYASEVESKYGEPKPGEDLHGVIDDLIVHRSTAEGMRVADDCGEACVRATAVEHGF